MKLVQVPGRSPTNQGRKSPKHPPKVVSVIPLGHPIARGKSSPITSEARQGRAVPDNLF